MNIKTAAGRTISAGLVFAIMCIQTVSVAEGLPAARAAIIKTNVAAIGVSEHVAVRLISGQKVHGCITAIGDKTFTVSPGINKPDRTISYDEVTKVKKAPNLLPWILGGLVVATVVLIVIIHRSPTAPVTAGRLKGVN